MSSTRTGKIVLILSCFAFMVLYSFSISSYPIKPTISTLEQKTTEDTLYQNIIIKTYLPQIQSASDSYYTDYFSVSPTVEYFSTTIKEIYTKHSINYITFATLPFIGAHNTVGKDEITFSVDNWGNINLVEFNHVESYSLPAHLNNLVK